MAEIGAKYACRARVRPCTRPPRPRKATAARSEQRCDKGIGSACTFLSTSAQHRPCANAVHIERTNKAAMSSGDGVRGDGRRLVAGLHPRLLRGVAHVHERDADHRGGDEQAATDAHDAHNRYACNHRQHRFL